MHDDYKSTNMTWHTSANKTSVQIYGICMYNKCTYMTFALVLFVCASRDVCSFWAIKQ